MSVDSKLTAIADAIREKTGGTDELTLDAMAQAIAALETGGGERVEWLSYIPAETITTEAEGTYELCGTSITTPNLIALWRMTNISQYSGGIPLVSNEVLSYVGMSHNGKKGGNATWYNSSLTAYYDYADSGKGYFNSSVKYAPASVYVMDGKVWWNSGSTTRYHEVFNAGVEYFIVVMGG